MLRQQYERKLFKYDVQEQKQTQTIAEVNKNIHKHKQILNT